MDTTAYLTRQGWLGSGHPLHPSGHGIAKPLLVSKKLDLLGLGQPKRDSHADQWWARDFDIALKHFNVGTSGATEPAEVAPLKTRLQLPERTVLSSPKWGMGILGNGLYGYFVKGESLSGTHTLEIMEKAKTDSCQNLQPMKIGHEAASRHKRHGKKARKRASSLTEHLSFANHFNSLTPERDICGNMTSKHSPRIVTRESETGSVEENQSRTSPAVVNTKEGSKGAKLARKSAFENKTARKKRRRRHTQNV